MAVNPFNWSTVLQYPSKYWGTKSLRFCALQERYAQKIIFPERYSDVKEVRLEENFRCSSKIVDVAANTILHNECRLPKNMTSGATIVSNLQIVTLFGGTSESGI